MTGRLVARGVCWLLAAVASIAVVTAVALLATDPDRHVRALAVLLPSVVAGVLAGLGLWETRRGAR